ncbi:hypothetical protein AAH979_12135 [Plantactinospora sp. ZYX-F-223]|uniref:hypothetical protein n=1 Tax=Plantactinospora sp. ZYX-F-223 TaxID=3144103 RepID=UPI0031FBA9F8
MEAVERADSSAPVIRVINGMAGIGKTALAVHLASQLTHRYPDAQLFVGLKATAVPPRWSRLPRW